MRQLIGVMTAHVHGTPGAVTSASPPLVQAFAELYDRSAAAMSPASRGRFAADVAQYLFTNYIEAFHRVRGGPDDLDTVTHMRRYSIGVLPSLGFGEPAGGFEVAAELVGGEPLQRMRIITSDVIAAVNEAFSLGKDLAIGETTSAAVVLMRLRGWTPEQTIHHLEDTVAELVDEFLALEDRARTQAERLGLPEEGANVERYVRSMRDWMIANLAWSEETPPLRRPRPPGVEGGPARPARPERPARPTRPAQPERPTRLARPERPDRIAAARWVRMVA